MMLGKGCSVLLLFLVFARNEAAGSKLKLARRNPGIANLAFTSNLEFVLEDLSDLNCARHCMRSPGCVTFTYSVVTKTCRGHSGVMTSSNPSFNLPDSVGFVVDWMGTDCDSDAHCSVKNAECFAGSCLCTPGYVYSHSGHNCSDPYDTEDLDDLTRTYLWGFDVTDNDIFSNLTGNFDSP